DGRGRCRRHLQRQFPGIDLQRAGARREKERQPRRRQRIARAAAALVHADRRVGEVARGDVPGRAWEAVMRQTGFRVLGCGALAIVFWIGLAANTALGETASVIDPTEGLEATKPAAQ